MKRAIALVLLLCGVANAGPLDLLYYGVKGNPDRYVSVDLRAVYAHDTGNGAVNGYLPQYYQGNDRGLKALFTVPLDENSSFVAGGQFHLSDYAWDQNSNATLPSQTGNVKGYTLEAGFKFYIHN